MVTWREAVSADDYIGARTLLLEYAAWVGVDLGFQGFTDELEQLQRVYAPPQGCMIVARDETGPVGCVGVRRRDPETCEMKRLFVSDRGRGLGLGRQLAVTAIEAARRLGYQRMLLDTLPQMTAAHGLYASLGFVETLPYYDNPVPGTRYMELRVRRPDATE